MFKKLACLSILSLSQVVSAQADCGRLNLLGVWGDSNINFKVSLNSSTSDMEFTSIHDYTDGCWGVHYIDTVKALVTFDAERCTFTRHYTHQINESFYKDHQVHNKARSDSQTYKILEVTGPRDEAQMVYAPCVDAACNTVQYQESQKIKRVSSKLDHATVPGGACSTGLIMTAVGCVPVVNE